MNFLAGLGRRRFRMKPPAARACILPATQSDRWFYNRAMLHLRLATPVLLALAIAGTGLTHAQTPPADTPASTSGQRPEQRIERIRIEDAGSRIDELRVGGETQSIVVSPKGGMPAYDVVPERGNSNLTRGERGSTGNTGGTRVWKVLGF
jgi:hypothetical protein